MYDSFPFSMENIPRQKKFGCFSLKFGSIFTGLLLILFSTFALAQSAALLSESSWTPDKKEGYSVLGIVVAVTLIHMVTLFLSTLMIVGVLREKPRFIKPWLVWTSIQVSVATMIFIFWTTMSVINYSASSSLVYFALEFVGILIRFYMLMIVASFYKEIQEENEDYERLKSRVNDAAWYSSA